MQTALVRRESILVGAEPAVCVWMGADSSPSCDLAGPWNSRVLLPYIGRPNCPYSPPVRMIEADQDAEPTNPFLTY
jgi:hypothetical protein